jgi:hypothetical protein
MARDRVDLDRLAALEDERSFLLRSLRDLDAEHAAGDVDDEDYVTLRDGYTRRAADVLRQIDAGRAELPPRRPGQWRRRLVLAVPTAAVAAGIGWFVADSSGQRLPGQEITGRAVGERDDVAELLTEARALLGGAGYVDAAERYRRVLDLEPEHVEATTYLAWLLFVGSGPAGGADVAAASRRALEGAIERDPQYADAHCLLAVVAENGQGDTATAQAEAETCLALDPPAEIEQLVAGFVATLDSAAPSAVNSSTP